MEPREFWDRNSILAEAFCASDERVRHAQAVLDEAQAERSRTLAAFAVTVGNDRAIADLMGLNERDVRLARRTVGKGDARIVAEALLERYPHPAPQIAHQPEQQVAPQPVPGGAPQPARGQGPGTVQGEAQGPDHGYGQESGPVDDSVADMVSVMEVQMPYPQSETVHPFPDTAQQNVTGAAYQAQETENNVAWSSSMDSVLLWSWQSGLDLQTVAAELGLDIRALLMRVQALADNGTLTPSTETTASDRSGRHRHEESDAAFFSPTTPARADSATRPRWR